MNGSPSPATEHLYGGENKILCVCADDAKQQIGWTFLCILSHASKRATNH